VGGIIYTFSVVVGWVFEGELNQRWERQRMERQIVQISDHFIVCGYGRVGRQIAAELHHEHRPLVVIDVHAPSLERARDAGLLIVPGNATEDATLHQAGIERARCLITAVANDADNIFVTLSARALRPNLPIVARANYDDAAAELRRAGATQVSPRTPWQDGRWPSWRCAPPRWTSSSPSCAASTPTCSWRTSGSPQAPPSSASTSSSPAVNMPAMPSCWPCNATA
jgi:hypothetical protein